MTNKIKQLINIVNDSNFLKFFELKTSNGEIKIKNIPIHNALIQNDAIIFLGKTYGYWDKLAFEVQINSLISVEFVEKENLYVIVANNHIIQVLIEN